MAKTIKFNLICDNKPIHTIEDLQNNFSIEDVLQYYNNRLLHRWLEVRGYNEELEKVKNVTVDKPIEVVKELIKIFKVMCDEKKIEESVYILEYLVERRELCSIYEKENYETKAIIDDYINGYFLLIDEILQNPSDVAMIKACISEMVSNYEWILAFNNRNLFYRLKSQSPSAIMCLLMNNQLRSYYLPIGKEDQNGEMIYETDLNEDKADIYHDICSMIKTNDFKTALGKNLITYAGVTDGYWRDLEPKGKKYMIIDMGSGDFVRSAGLSGGDLSSADINNKFVIVDGIDYKSNSSSRQLLYMEV